MNRTGNKWTVNEILSLQREFELLGWDIDQIAKKHARTANAIMYKLDKEGFADYNVLYSNYHTKIPVSRTAKVVALEPSLEDDVSEDEIEDKHDEDYVDNGEDDDDDEEDEEDDDPLSKRVSKLESGIDEIKTMLRALTTQQGAYGSNGVPRGVDF